MVTWFFELHFCISKRSLRLAVVLAPVILALFPRASNALTVQSMTSLTILHFKLSCKKSVLFSPNKITFSVLILSVLWCAHSRFPSKAPCHCQFAFIAYVSAVLPILTMFTSQCQHSLRPSLAPEWSDWRISPH
jgi:hypothetical protein